MPALLEWQFHSVKELLNFLKNLAEGEGFEPPWAEARRISSPLPYQLGLTLPQGLTRVLISFVPNLFQLVDEFHSQATASWPVCVLSIYECICPPFLEFSSPRSPLCLWCPHRPCADKMPLYASDRGSENPLWMVDRYTHISTEHKRATMLLLEGEIRPLIETNSKQMNSVLS